MARAWLAGLLTAGLLLSGCWDRTEIEDTAFVVALAVDAADQEFLWTFQTVEAGHLPVGMLSTPPRPPRADGLITVRGSSLEQAAQLVQAGLSRIVSLEHLRYVVFGQALAERGLDDLLHQLLRHNQVRRSMGAAVALGRAADTLVANRSLADVNPAKSLEGLLLVQKRMHLSPPMRLQNFFGRLLATGMDPILPLIAINPLAQQPPGSDLPPMAGRSLEAGEFPRAGGNPVELAGTAIFRADRLVGRLNVDETSAILALRGEMGKVYASVPDPTAADQELALRIHQENIPQYQAGFAGGRPVVRVKLQFEGEILSTGGRTAWTNPTNRRMLEAAAARYLEQTVYTPLLRRVYGEWGADPVGLGNLFRTRFPTFSDWLAYNWPDHVRDVQVTADIELSVRRFGLLLDGDTTQHR